ncbi:adenylyltransferase/cytidyltransferase family protein [Candidatus Phytoplasma australasiaticum]
MRLLNNCILRKVVLVSYFLSLVIFIDLAFGKVLTSFLHLPLGGQVFKISLVILCLSGIYNSFLIHLLICCLYAVFHLIKSYNFFISLNQIFLLIEEYLSYLSDLRKNNIKSNFKNISAIVMNANPFTKGHQYLVETASNNSDLVYIIMVKEDVSLFSYKQRKEMVKLFTENIKNVFIVEGSNYLVSRNVFPSYFLSSPEKVIRSQIILDTHIFKNYIARNLGIKKRYVGEEPFSPTTNLYNVIMQEVLVKSEIELVVCPRLMWDFKSISATQVRKLFITGNFKDMKNLVPTTTLKFLQKLNYKKYAQDPKLSKLIDKSF